MFHKNNLLKKLKSMKLFRRSSKVSTLPRSCRSDLGIGHEIEWELRPGGMLVQKRKVNCGRKEEEIITLKVSNGSTCHDISIEATSTFGELKARLSMVTRLEAKEQRLLYKGKERDDYEHLHMVGVCDQDKILLLQDPAAKEMKLNAIPGRRAFPVAASLRRSITVNF
uniref:Ubiquitin-like domain-containing protein n=1 Tax=Kalanchoe fedtschenkoi TaxID=63787 RepID=A0A7N0TV22_KALFE